MGILDIEAQRQLQHDSGLLGSVEGTLASSRAIPQALLDLLSHAWQRTGGFSEFEQSYGMRSRPLERYGHEAGVTNLDSAFTTEEVEGLVEAGMLDGVAERRNGSYRVITHAEHAVADFCSEVYEAFDRLTARMETIRAENGEANCPHHSPVPLLD